MIYEIISYYIITIYRTIYYTLYFVAVCVVQVGTYTSELGDQNIFRVVFTDV